MKRAASIFGFGPASRARHSPACLAILKPAWHLKHNFRSVFEHRRAGADRWCWRPNSRVTGRFGEGTSRRRDIGGGYRDQPLPICSILTPGHAASAEPLAAIPWAKRASVLRSPPTAVALLRLDLESAGHLSDNAITSASSSSVSFAQALFVNLQYLSCRATIR